MYVAKYLEVSRFELLEGEGAEGGPLARLQQHGAVQH